jgi:hypothetical protein
MHNEELHNLYSSPNILGQASQVRKDGWDRRKIDIGFWCENLAQRAHLIDLGVDGIRIKLISKKHDGRVWTGLIWNRLETSSGLL